MGKFVKKSFSRLAGASLLVAALGYGSAASAGPAIGFDPTGTGTYTTYADLWTNVTDSALAIGFVPNTPVSLDDPTTWYTTDLVAQARVGTTSLGAVINTPLGLNQNISTPIQGFELTKVLRIQELVIEQTDTTAQFTLGGTQPDIDSATAGSQQLMIFFDPLGDGSVAVPGDGAGTVSCYGAGPTACANDGILILSASAFFGASSFAVDPVSGGLTGTGSFDLQFLIDYVNTDYLDIALNSIIGDKITGTVNIPTLFTPNVMWDGTATANNILFKLDSSETFIAAVPEPGSLALVGLSLAALGFVARRRRAD